MRATLRRWRLLMSVVLLGTVAVPAAAQSADSAVTAAYLRFTRAVVERRDSATLLNAAFELAVRAMPKTKEGRIEEPGHDEAWANFTMGYAAAGDWRMCAGMAVERAKIAEDPADRVDLAELAWYCSRMIGASPDSMRVIEREGRLQLAERLLAGDSPRAALSVLVGEKGVPAALLRAAAWLARGDEPAARAALEAAQANANTAERAQLARALAAMPSARAPRGVAAKRTWPRPPLPNRFSAQVAITSSFMPTADQPATEFLQFGQGEWAIREYGALREVKELGTRQVGGCLGVELRLIGSRVFVPGRTCKERRIWQRFPGSAWTATMLMKGEQYERSLSSEPLRERPVSVARPTQGPPAAAERRPEGAIVGLDLTATRRMNGAVVEQRIGDTWVPISPPLTRGEGTAVVTVARDRGAWPDQLVVGTSDGNVATTMTGGRSWFFLAQFAEQPIVDACLGPPEPGDVEAVVAVARGSAVEIHAATFRVSKSGAEASDFVRQWRLERQFANERTVRIEDADGGWCNVILTSGGRVRRSDGGSASIATAAADGRALARRDAGPTPASASSGPSASASSGPAVRLDVPPIASTMIVARFLEAANDSNIAVMGESWGSRAGAASARRNPADWERRMVLAMQPGLAGLRSVVRADNPGADTNHRVVTVDYDRSGCKGSADFIVVRTNTGAWLVESFPLADMPAPGARCGR